MNILVTGGAGYIGSVVVDQLIAANHRVVVFDNLSHGHKEAVNSKATFIEGDLSNKNVIEETLKVHGISAVMHFAAFIEAGESMKDPGKYFANNTASTVNLLNAMQAQGIQKLVFSSTAALYGNPKITPITEESQLHPTNAYGESKLLVERMLRWYNQIYGLQYATLRYFNAAGATDTRGEEHQPESHLIPLALQAAIGKREKLKLYGTDYPTSDGTCIRDYIHVSDLATAHLLAFVALEKATEPLIYNLGSQTGYSNLQVIETVGSVLGIQVPYEEAPRRPGDPTILIASSEKIKKELGWEPKYNLKAIVESAVKWRQQHPDGY